MKFSPSLGQLNVKLLEAFFEGLRSFFKNCINCTTPIFVRVCPEPPEPPVPVTRVHVDAECNSTTGNYDYITSIFIDEVLQGAPAVADSGIACTEDKPQIVQSRVCDAVTETIHIVTSSVLGTTISVIDDTDTLEKCVEECVERTWTRSVATSAGVIPAGAIAVGVHNHGAGDGVLAGGPLHEGETDGVSARGCDTLGAIAYDPQGAEFIISELR